MTQAKLPKAQRVDFVIQWVLDFRGFFQLSECHDEWESENRVASDVSCDIESVLDFLSDTLHKLDWVGFCNFDFVGGCHWGTPCDLICGLYHRVHLLSRGLDGRHDRV